jgi:hypothetical protein
MREQKRGGGSTKRAFDLPISGRESALGDVGGLIRPFRLYSISDDRA